MHDDHGKSGEGQFEKTDMHLKMVLWTGVLVVLLAVGSFGLGIVMMKALGGREPMTKWKASDLAPAHEEWPSDVRLQQKPEVDLIALKSEQTQKLNSFGVVSEEPAIYHIPIETAIDLVAKNGFPKFQPLDAALGIVDPAAAAPAEAPH